MKAMDEKDQEREHSGDLWKQIHQRLDLVGEETVVKNKYTSTAVDNQLWRN